MGNGEWGIGNGGIGEWGRGQEWGMGSRGMGEGTGFLTHGKF